MKFSERTGLGAAISKGAPPMTCWRSTARFSFTDLGIDQEPYHLDEFASQSRSAKRDGAAVGAVNQKRELIAELTRIARAESASE
jgi:hypothetical protein